MEVVLIKENPDGSADYSFEMTDEERQSLMRWAIIEALKRGIEEGKNLAVKGEIMPQDNTQMDLFEGENKNES
jgi:hypothetical protein